jgi:LysR family glycine cleavage system transcriptional activator
VPRRLPPLNACRAFEAAARLSSFTRAAEELHVTQTAVSHQVKLLEQWLGTRLFQRHNNQVSLTAHGKSLQPVLWDALERLAHGVETVANPASVTPLIISAQPNFAFKWLIPRLADFAKKNPLIEPHILTTDRTHDLANTDIDVAIRHADMVGVSDSVPLDVSCELICAAKMFPVASPRLMATTRLERPEDLDGQTLLHVIGAADDWSMWLSAAGVHIVDPERGPRFDSYAASVEAAAHGWGVAMGMDIFVQEDIDNGRLVAPFDLRLPRSAAWYLLTAKHFQKPNVLKFRTWILAQAGRRI